jgi:hypothetical protein
MEIERLVDQNPWWKDKQEIEKDYDIERWKSKKYSWTPKILDEIVIKPFSLHIILGPRQTGKTTAVKLLIRRMLEHRDGRSIFYFNCEELSDYKELLDILGSYLEFKETCKIKNSLIVLDEVTSPKEWYRAIKSLIDKGKVRNDVLILTGSSSIAIKHQVELFPGRRGKGRDFILMPLSFREFIKVLNPGLYKHIEKIKINSLSKLMEKSAEMVVYLKELNAMLEKYFVYGGFPLGIAAINGKKEEAKITYLSWIKTAVLKTDKSDTIARQIVKVVLEKMSSTLSWEGVSKEIEIKSPKTVSSYIELFKTMFVLILLYNIDISKKRIKFGRNKKIHFIDPLLLEIFEDWCLVKIKNRESVIAESLVATHLARMFPERVFFWKNGFEVDVLVMDDDGLKGFEVKWKEQSKARALSQLKSFTIVTKKHFSQKPNKIPLAVFLALIEI